MQYTRIAIIICFLSNSILFCEIASALNQSESVCNFTLAPVSFTKDRDGDSNKVHNRMVARQLIQIVKRNNNIKIVNVTGLPYTDLYAAIDEILNPPVDQNGRSVRYALDEYSNKVVLYPEVEALASDKKDHYGILEIPPTATLAQIRAAYRNEIRKCHPDLYPHDPKKEERAKAVIEAYAVLSDDNFRAIYDRSLSGTDNAAMGNTWNDFGPRVEDVVMDDFASHFGGPDDIFGEMHARRKQKDALKKRCLSAIKSDDIFTRESAVLTLGDFKDEFEDGDVIQALINVLKEDSEPIVTLAAAMSLGRIGDNPGVVSAMLDYLKSVPPGGNLAKYPVQIVMASLENIASKEAVKGLRLNSYNPETRIAVMARGCLERILDKTKATDQTMYAGGLVKNVPAEAASLIPAANGKEAVIVPEPFDAGKRSKEKTLLFEKMGFAGRGRGAYPVFVVKWLEQYSRIDLHKYGIEETLNVMEDYLRKRNVYLVRWKEQVNDVNSFALDMEGNIYVEDHTYLLLLDRRPDLIAYGMLRPLLIQGLGRRGIDSKVIRQILTDNFGRSMIGDGELITRYDDQIYLWRTARADIRNSDPRAQKIMAEDDKVVKENAIAFVHRTGGWEKIKNMPVKEFIRQLVDILNIRVREILPSKIETFRDALSRKNFHSDAIRSALPCSRESPLETWDDPFYEKQKQKLGEVALSALGIEPGDRLIYRPEYLPPNDHLAKTMLFHEALESVAVNERIVDQVYVSLSGHANLGVMERTFWFARGMGVLNDVVDIFERGIQSSALTQCERVIAGDIVSFMREIRRNVGLSSWAEEEAMCQPRQVSDNIDTVLESVTLGGCEESL